MNRFSQKSFIDAPKRYAIGLLLHLIGADTQNEKQIELINKFFNVEKFVRVGSGAYANVFKINDKEVLRISKSLPTPLPNDPLINQRSGFLKINGYYIEKFPLLSLDVDTTHLEHIREDLTKRHPEIWDLHSGNFGKDPETGKIKVLDPGCFDDVHHQNMMINETKFMELQHKYKNLLDAVKDNPTNIRFIPEEYITEEMVIEAVRRDGELLSSIKNQTEKIALEAVKNDGWAIRFVKNPTPEICLEAVKNNGTSLRFVKEQTYEICLAAVKQNKGAFSYVKDPQIKERIIKELGLEKISRFSKQFFKRYTSNIGSIKGLLVEIKANPNDKKLIDQINKFFNVEMFKYLGRGAYAKVYQINDKEVLRISHSLPQPLPNDPHVNQRSGFLKINGHYIEKFPLLDTDIDYEDTELVENELMKKYPEVWDLHGENFGRDLETGKIKVLDPGTFVPRKKEDELYNENKFMELQHKYKNLLDAVKNDPVNIQYIPEEYQTEEMALIAAKHEPWLLQYIENQTEKICLEAVKNDGDALRYVRVQTPQICLEAVKNDGTSLRFVKDQTYEICREAIKNTKTMINYVKDPQMKERITHELGLKKTSRFSKQFFTRFSSNKEAVKQLLTIVRANPEDQKLIDQVNKFFNVEMFEYLGSGLHANVYKINNNQVLRISGSLPMPLPKDKRINPRQGFLKINGFYIELFPLMDTTKLITNDEIERLEKELKKDYPQVFDLHNENFGCDPQTGEPKVIDPGCFVPLDKENELYNENEFMRLQKEYKNLLDAIKADTLNIIHIPVEYQTEEMALYIAKHAPNRIGYIAKLSERAAIEAVKNDPWALLYMKDENKTYKVCLEAARKGGVKMLTFRGVSEDVARRVREALGV